MFELFARAGEGFKGRTHRGALYSGLTEEADGFDKLRTALIAARSYWPGTVCRSPSPWGWRVSAPSRVPRGVWVQFGSPWDISQSLSPVPSFPFKASFLAPAGEPPAAGRCVPASVSR